MKKKAKRRGSRRTPPTRRKLSPQLNFLLSLGLRAVRNLARTARAKRLTQSAKIEELSEQAGREQYPERRAEIEREIGVLVEGIPAPLVHGVYFPTDRELNGDAPVRAKKPYVSAFIKSQCAGVDLENLGIQVRQQAGDIFTAFVPWDLLERLAEMPGIDFIELARPMRRDLNTALPYSQITDLQAPPAGLTGAGVIVGVTDDFLFFYHPNFRKGDGKGGDQQGSTRVLFIWDQSLEVLQGSEKGPTGIPGFTATHGVEYSHADINTDLDNFAPPITMAYKTVRHEATLAGTHGTHVCGIAAGNSHAQVGAPTGAAPGADIIFVRDIGKDDVWHSDSTNVADAFAYIFARAKLLGRPCVVNMSSSDNLGPHDGTSLGEQFLDNLLLTPGRVITVAAGNTTGEAEHTRGAVPPSRVRPTSRCASRLVP